jgi:DinB superfamily
MNATTVLIKTAIQRWDDQVNRAALIISERSDETLAKQVATGKNTGAYVIGHLIAINDAMVQILGLGKPKYPDLFDTYIRHPDGVGHPGKTIPELRELWKETHDRITALVHQFPEENWLKRHANVTDEQFAQNPLRNKLSVLLNRAEHIAFHSGQLRLL